jgi:hypothetical protein
MNWKKPRVAIVFVSRVHLAVGAAGFVTDFKDSVVSSRDESL